MLSQTVDYALRISVCLAVKAPTPQTADNLAQLTNVPRAYQAKVIQAMVRGGTARSKRGVGGGISLAKPPEEITLLEIINSVDPIKRLGATVTEPEERIDSLLLGLQQRYERALHAAEQVFREATLADVIAERA